MLFRNLLRGVLILLIINNGYTNESDEELFCFVDFDSPSIFVNSTMGKDTSYTASSFDHHASLLNFDYSFRNDSNWTLINSINANKNQRTKGPVLDQRWENFSYNNIEKEYDIVGDLLKRKEFSIALSIKNYQNISYLGWNATMSWHHVVIEKKAPNQIFLRGLKNHNLTESSLKHLIDKSLKSINIWKIHDYDYYYTVSLSNETRNIYSAGIGNNCDRNMTRCLYFYVALCLDCMINIEVKDFLIDTAINRTFSATKDREWEQVKMCHEMTECIEISVKTSIDTTSNIKDGFWALGQEIYFSNCTFGTRYLSYRNNSAVDGCEDVNSKEKINRTTVKDLSCPHKYSEKIKEHKILDTIETLEPVQEMREKSPDDHLLQTIGVIIVIFILLTMLVIFVIIVIVKRHNKSRFSSPSNVQTDSIPLLHSKEFSRQNDFVKYVEKFFGDNNGLDQLRKRFDTLPKGFSDRHTAVGSRPENDDKNSFKKIIAYDETRVILLDTEDTSYTGDYINANYVEGIQNNQEYIVTQNPIPATVNIFWRMIWQENVSYIVMLTTKGQQFTQYWPERLSHSELYGAFEVTPLKEEHFEFYSCRELRLNYRDQVKLVSHYHFHSWFQDNLPCFPHVLLPLIKKVLTFSRRHPIVIHCYTGIGKSGVTVLCDTAIQLAEKDQPIDMHAITENIRKCRFWLVGRLDSYKLAHLIVLEYLLDRQIRTTLTGPYFKQDYKLWSQSSMGAFKTLQKFSWINEVIEPFVYVNDSPSENRYPNLKPVKHSQVFVQHLTKLNEQVHLNAHFVDGYKVPQKYIVAQRPLRETLHDFWCMIVRHKIVFIVDLNELDQSSGASCSFYFDNIRSKLQFSSELIVSCKEIHANTDFDKLTLRVNYKSREYDICYVNMKKWSRSHDVPDNSDTLIQIWDLMNNSISKLQTALICCDDGVKASGLFVGLCYLFDKASKEDIYDAVFAVKTIRRSHPKFIPKQQFEFILKAAQTFHSYLQKRRT